MFSAVGLLLLGWFFIILWIYLTVIEEVFIRLKRKYVFMCSCPLPPNLPWGRCLSPCKWCDYLEDWAYEKESLGHPYRGKYE